MHPVANVVVAVVAAFIADSICRNAFGVSLLGFILPPKKMGRDDLAKVIKSVNEDPYRTNEPWFEVRLIRRSLDYCFKCGCFSNLAKVFIRAQTTPLKPEPGIQYYGKVTICPCCGTASHVNEDHGDG